MIRVSPGRIHLLGCLLGVALSCSPAQAGPAGPIAWGEVSAIGGGWGRMVQLARGPWLCVTTEYPSGESSFLRVHRSLDDGRTWTGLAEVKEAGRTLDNGELVLLPDGTVLLTMRSLVSDTSYRLPLYASTDSGVSWGYRSTIDAREDSGSGGLWEPDLWVLADGRLTVTYSNESHPGYSQVISQRVSADQGVTWGEEQWAVYENGGGGLRPGMSQLARMANGSYILVYEIVNAGHADVHCKFSDDGVTWPDGLGTRIPCQHCGPFVCSLPNGLLLISSCENQVSYSEDYGLTWQKLDPPAWDLGFQFSWPALYVTGPDEVAVMVVSPGVRLRFGDLSPGTPWPDPYVETFDTGMDPAWSRYGGNIRFADGAYLLANEGTFGKSMTGDGFWTDGTLAADVMLTSPGNAGLMFRTTNPDYSGPDHAFGYYAGLDTGGHLVLGRMSNAWQPLASTPVAVAMDTWYRLAVILERDEIAVHVNDSVQPLITHVDNTFHRGQIGVRAFQCDARFDNVMFTNAAPLQLAIQPAAEAWDVTWPETSVATRLFTRSALDDMAPGVLVPHAQTLSNRTWRVRLEPPVEARGFYRLQGL